MNQSKQDECASVAWTPWLALDEVAVPMALHTDQTLDELGDTLLHLQALGAAQFGQDMQGKLWFRTRMDQAARMTALLDDHTRARRN